MPSSAPGTTTSSSLIITTRNRGPQLRRGLASIAARGYRGLECILVDDDSTDPETAAVIALHPWLQVVRMGEGREYRRRPGRVMNVGHLRATGEVHLEQSAEVVHLTDCVTPLVAACRPGVMVLATVLNGSVDELAAVEREVASGAALPPDADSREPGFVLDHGTSVNRRQQVGAVNVEVYCGAARPTPYMFLGALHRDDWRQLKGYDEGCPNPHDWDLASRFMTAGGTFRWIGRALAFHLRHGKV